MVLGWAGRVVRWCWVNFQCRGVLQIGLSRAGAYCACSRCGWGCLDIFTLIYPFSPLSPSLWETVRYRLKYCLKGSLDPKQPTNQPTMVLGKLPVPGRSIIWMTVGQGPIALAVVAGRGLFGHFTLRYLFSPPSPSLWETARYRLKYCLQGPLNPNQPTNQPTN